MTQVGRFPPWLRPLLQAGGVLGAAALIWWVGPLVAIAGVVPLAGEGARGAALAALLAVSLTLAGGKALQARRNNAKLLDGLVAQEQEPAAPTAEVELLGRRFKEAVAQLRRARLGAHRSWRRLLSPNPYLYELPWYLIIGAPGAGKTTALVNSGLNFPLPERLGHGQALRGVGGTRNCDWWFTDQAVLLDTAGRYTTQDSHQATDRAAWLGFLDLLKRHRPRRPINGVLLTVSIADLLGAGPQARHAHALALRARIAELRQRLNLRFPVYVLVTKTDLLAGFMEFFADLDKDERAQVWGFTLPAEGGPMDPLPLISSELAALEKRLGEYLLERLHAEADRERRAALFAFPQQWRLLHELLLELLQTTFAPEVPGEAGSAAADPAAAAGGTPAAGTAGATAPALLRGVYFTSATQEGTPMDRALGGIARALGLSARLLAPARPGGRSFFVTRLLRDVVFAEAGLAGTNLRRERRRAALQLGLSGLCLALAAGVTLLGWRAYGANRDLLAGAAAQLPALRQQALAAQATAPTDLTALLPVLSGLERFTQDAAGQGTSAQPPHAQGLAPASLEGAAASFWSLGLDRDELLAATAGDAYARLLREALLPRIAARLETRLRSGAREHVELVYEALRAYLMLFAGRNFDPAALRADLASDWEATLPATEAQRAALHHHLQRLLAGGEVGAPQRADPQLIAQARALVAGVPVAERVYNRLRQGDAGAAPFSIASVAGAGVVKYFNRASGRPLDEGVPGFYTRAVYPQRLRERTQEVLRQLDRERAWVLGSAGARAMPIALNVPAPAAAPAGTTSAAAGPGSEAGSGAAPGPGPASATAGVVPPAPVNASLAEAVEQLYLADHARHWDSFMADLRLAPTATPAASVELAQALSRADSPLAQLLRALAREVAASPVLAPRHEALTRFVAGTPAPLDEALSQLGAAGQQLTVIEDALRNRRLPPPVPAFKNLASVAAQAPAPVNALLSPFAATAGAQALTALREPLSRQLSAEVGTACSRALEGRYPFARGATQEVAREDFIRFFGAGGVVDAFVQRQLLPYGESATPAGLQRARQVREAFFSDGGRRFGVQLELRLLELDPALSDFSLEVDGQALRFKRELKAAQTLRWPGAGDAPGRVTLRAGQGSGYSFDGPWALLRLLDRVRMEPLGGGRVELVFDVEGRKARFEARSATALNPLLRAELESFTCPRHL